MKDSIYTIPVNEVFEKKCGCPLCKIRDTLEEKCLTEVMGAAMMEPDIRIKTNEMGFCTDHFRKMLEQKNRLSLALMLESHLDQIRKGKYGDILRKSKTKKTKRMNEKTISDTCYVCDKIKWAMEGMVRTLLRQYQMEAEFRRLFEEQEALCLPHLEMLLCAAQDEMSKKYLNDFTQKAIALTEKEMEIVFGDVSHFCKMFDYRNSGADADWGNSKDAIERAIALLSARDFRDCQK